MIGCKGVPKPGDEESKASVGGTFERNNGAVGGLGVFSAILGTGECEFQSGMLPAFKSRADEFPARDALQIHLRRWPYLVNVLGKALYAS